MLVIEGKGFVIVVNLRQVRVGEDFGEDRQASPLFGCDLAVLLSLPTTLPALLVLPVFGIADAGFGLDVVEPSVFHPLP